MSFILSKIKKKKNYIYQRQLI